MGVLTTLALTVMLVASTGAQFPGFPFMDPQAMFQGFAGMARTIQQQGMNMARMAGDGVRFNTNMLRPGERRVINQAGMRGVAYRSPDGGSSGFSFSSGNGGPFSQSSGFSFSSGSDGPHGFVFRDGPDGRFQRFF